MENASKALIMAGGVLIALMILGALILMFYSLSSYQNSNTQNTRDIQVVEFNRQFETYDRTNVRGSDLYSLLNRVIDYNRRKSTEGTGKDEGQYLAYEPMTVTFKIDVTKLKADGGTNLLFISSQANNTYTVDKNANTFENDIKSTIDSLENKYGSDALSNLASNITRIFVADNATEQEKAEAVKKFNNISRKVKISSWDDIKSGKTIRQDVYKYYEYIQFKRAYFNCTNVKYNNQTGRIVKMDFEFTGKFN